MRESSGDSVTDRQNVDALRKVRGSAAETDCTVSGEEKKKGLTLWGTLSRVNGKTVCGLCAL
jgi:hypothetical protein